MVENVVRQKTGHLPLIEHPDRGSSNVRFVERADILSNTSDPRRHMVYVAGRTKRGIVTSQLVRVGDDTLVEPGVDLYLGLRDYVPLKE